MKTRTMNELRQEKEYQGIANIHTTDKSKWDVEGHKKYNQEKAYQNCTGDVKTGTKNPFEHAEVDKAVDEIVETLQPEIFDAIFEAINNEMSHNFLFQADNYLTEAGEELFEDQWFEFYHEQHGKIMHKLLKNLK